MFIASRERGRLVSLEGFSFSFDLQLVFPLEVEEIIGSTPSKTIEIVLKFKKIDDIGLPKKHQGLFEPGLRSLAV